MQPHSLHLCVAADQRCRAASDTACCGGWQLRCSDSGDNLTSAYKPCLRLQATHVKGPTRGHLCSEQLTKMLPFTLCGRQAVAQYDDSCCDCPWQWHSNFIIISCVHKVSATHATCKSWQNISLALCCHVKCSRHWQPKQAKQLLLCSCLKGCTSQHHSQQKPRAVPSPMSLQSKMQLRRANRLRTDRAARLVQCQTHVAGPQGRPKKTGADKAKKQTEQA